MILFKGETYDSARQDELLEKLEENLLRTLSAEPLDIERLTAVLDSISQRLTSGYYSWLTDTLDIEDRQSRILEAARLLKKENIERKRQTELPELSDTDSLRKKRAPLGVLLHIAAGNMDVLPAYTVIEGLLAGNINILKLPSSDNGITITIMQEMIALMPELKEYIYVFDTPGTDEEAIMKMAELANGIVVWGSDEAVRAIRSKAPAKCKIIEWGHKLSFAYLDMDYSPVDLEDIARHLNSTRQLLCSSAQLIYLDTKNIDDLRKLAQDLIEPLNRNLRMPDVGSVARMTLYEYTSRLEQAAGHDQRERIAFDHGFITISDDSELEACPQYGEIVIKPLPAADIVRMLHKHRSHLQTAGTNTKRQDVIDALIKAGVTRITSLENMSHYIADENHDGRYALSEYTRIVDIEK